MPSRPNWIRGTFYAKFEVDIENGWWLIDPTRLALIGGIVLIGPDESDIAFLTFVKQRQVPQTIQASTTP